MSGPAVRRLGSFPEKAPPCAFLVPDGHLGYRECGRPKHDQAHRDAFRPYTKGRHPYTTKESA